MKLVFIALLITLTISACFQTKLESNQNTNFDNKEVNEINQALKITPSPPNKSKEEKVIEWQAKVKDNSFYWNGKDLTIALLNERKKKLFSEIAKDEFEFSKKDDSMKVCLEDLYFRPIAVAGNFLSYEFESSIFCGATVSGSWAYNTVYFSKTGDSDFQLSNKQNSKIKNLSLEDIFSETDIFEALMENPQISKDISELIKNGKINSKPSNLEELKKIMSKFYLDFFQSSFYFDDNFLSSFTFHNTKEDRICVWVSLMPISHANQADREHIELFLPIPEKLRQDFELANSKESGFLFKDADNMVGTNFANFEMSYNKK